MAVHTYGLAVDMEPLLALARRHGLHVIEDAAEAHGAKCRGRPCGSFGDVSTFSFYANKLVTTGENGDAAEALGKLAVFAGVSEFPSRVKCATLAWHTLEAALAGDADRISTE